MIDLTHAYRGRPFTKTGEKRLRKLVLDQMQKSGKSGHSASGRSALMAIEWCEAHADGWKLSHINGGGYVVEAIDFKKEIT